MTDLKDMIVDAIERHVLEDGSDYACQDAFHCYLETNNIEEDDATEAQTKEFNKLFAEAFIETLRAFCDNMEDDMHDRGQD